MYLTMFYVVIDVNETRFYFINKSPGLLSELHHNYCAYSGYSGARVVKIINVAKSIHLHTHATNVIMTVD